MWLSENIWTLKDVICNVINVNLNILSLFLNKNIERGFNYWSKLLSRKKIARSASWFSRDFLEISLEHLQTLFQIWHLHWAIYLPFQAPCRLSIPGFQKMLKVWSSLWFFLRKDHQSRQSSRLFSLESYHRPWFQLQLGISCKGGPFSKS